MLDHRYTITRSVYFEAVHCKYNPQKDSFNGTLNGTSHQNYRTIKVIKFDCPLALELFNVNQFLGIKNSNFFIGQSSFNWQFKLYE